MSTEEACKMELDGELMKKLLVCEADTLLARRFCEKFGKTNDWIIKGTVRDKDVDRTLIPFVKALVPKFRDDASEFKKNVLDADVIICPLRDSMEDAWAAIRMLSNTAFEVEKTFVLVSSVQTWANTYVATKAEEAAERAAERQAMIEAGEEPPPEEEEPPPAEEEFPTYTEDQYQKRVPHQRFQQWKELEHFAKKVNSETLHTYVIFSGICYGHGEDMLYPLFQSAWFSRPLPMITDGSNYVPMIHVNDLATFIYKVGSSSDTLPQRYMLGVDKGNCTWGAALRALNGAMGCGETFPLPPSRHETIQFAEHFKINLKFDPSAIVDLIDESEAVSLDGFVANIEKVVQEFKEVRGVTPIRSVVVGPPHCGKSLVASAIASQYRINHLHIAGVISDYKQYAESLQAQLHARLQEKAAQKRKAARDEKRRQLQEAAAAAAEARVAATAADEVPHEEGEEHVEPPAEDVARGNEEDEIDENDVDFDDKLAPKPPVEVPEGEAPPPKEAEPEPEPEPEDEEDEQYVALRENITQAQRILKLTVKPKKAQEQPLDDEGNPIPPAETQPVSDAWGRPFGEIKDTEEDKVEEKVPEPEKEVPPRFEDAALASMVRWKIRQMECRNQGFILDGFPKTVRQAVMTFIVGDVPMPEGDEPAESGEAEEDLSAVMNAVDDKLLPENIFVLNVADIQLLQSRCSETDPHRNVDSFLRRLQLFMKETSSQRPQKSLLAWFRAIMTNREGAPRETLVTTIDVSDIPAAATISEISDVLGPAHFFHPTPEEIIAEAREKKVEQERRNEARMRAEERAARTAADSQRERELERKKHERRYRSIQEEQAETAAMQNLPIQTYLLRYVVTALTKGVAHVVALRPENPVDCLADFLFNYQAASTL